MLRGLRLGDTVVHRPGSVFASLHRSLMLAVVGVLIASLFAPFASADDWAPPSRVWVETSGQTIDQTFLTTWRTNSDLLGQPISREFRDRMKLDRVKTRERTVQYFENFALVSTTDDKRGDDWNVRALPLGAEALELDAKRLKGTKLATSGDCDGYDEATCRAFKSTGFTVKNGFKAFWEGHQGEQLIGAPLSEEFLAKDGWTTQYFENGVLLWKQESGVVSRAVGKEAAKRKGVRTEGRAQPADVPVYSEALFTPPVEVTTPVGPGPVQGGDKEVVVSISEQYMWAYENGVVVIESYVSTGTAETVEVETPIGNWSVLTKVPMQTMEGTINGEYYRVEDVPNILYFDNLGNALHGTYWHNNFGTPMSHGCVNLPLDVAEFVYNWAYVGMPVTVIP